jgi:hypothetical protein
MGTRVADTATQSTKATPQLPGCAVRQLAGSGGPALVIEVLELPEREQKMALVPDERAVQELAAAGLAPSVP